MGDHQQNPEPHCPQCGNAEAWHGVITEPDEAPRSACDECGHIETRQVEREAPAATVQYRDLLPAALAAVVFALAAVILAVIFAASDQPDTDANVGKCIQAQRVLYQADRGQAAEKCLAMLDADGPERFSRTWQNYQTEPGSW